MRQYELITILRNTDTAQLEEIKKTLQTILERYNVEVVKEEVWGDRTFPHDIGHFTAGHFVLNICKIAPEKVKDLSHDLGIEQGVLRYMVKRAA